MMENTLQPDNELENQQETQSSPPPEQGPETGAVESKVPDKKLQDELTEAKDKYLRLYAEFDNYRRRSTKEKIEIIQSANEELIKLLLPVLDDFARADKAFKDRTDRAAEGFFLIETKFKKILESSGVKIMEIAPGADFNPDIHDAITQVPTTDEKLKGKIVDVVENGYLLNEKVIRHAKVVIGN